ncbi:MAG: PKD domain-containing protein [Saprospiraceae bacterium]
MRISLCALVFALFWTFSAVGQTYTIDGSPTICFGDVSSYEVTPTNGLPFPSNRYVDWTVPSGICNPFENGTVLTFEACAGGSFLIQAAIVNFNDPTQVENISLNVVVNDRPDTEIVIPAASICLTGGDPVPALCVDRDSPQTFTAELPGLPSGGSVTWSETGYADILSSSGASATFQAAGPVSGTRQFGLIASFEDASGCIFRYEIKTVIFEAIPTADITLLGGFPVPETVCLGEELDLTVTNPEPPIDPSSIRWEHFDPTGNLIATGGNLIFPTVYDIAGEHTIQLYGSSQCGCGGFLGEVLIFVEGSEALEILCPDVVCGGDIVDYTIAGTPDPNCTYTWSAVGGDILGSNTGNTVQIQWPTNNGPATGQVIITPSNCGGCTTATIVDVPIIGTSALIDGDICAYNTANSNASRREVNLTTDNYPGASYTWTVDGVTQQSILSEITYEIPRYTYGPIQVEVEIETPYGCNVLGSTIINAVPGVRTFPSVICQGNDADIRFNGYTASTPTSIFFEVYESGVQQIPANSSLSGNVSVYSANLYQIGLDILPVGSYVFVITMYDQGGVIVSTCVEERVFEVISSQLIVDLQGPTEVCLGQTATYVANVSPAPPSGTLVSYVWKKDGVVIPPPTGRSIMVEWTTLDGTIEVEASLIVAGASGPLLCGSGTSLLSVTERTPPELTIQRVRVGNPTPLDPLEQPCPGSTETLQLYCDGAPCTEIDDIVWTISDDKGALDEGIGQQTDVEWLYVDLSDPDNSLNLTISVDGLFCGNSIPYSVDLTMLNPSTLDVEVVKEFICQGDDSTDPIITVATSGTGTTPTDYEFKLVGRGTLGSPYQQTVSTSNPFLSASELTDFPDGIINVQVKGLYGPGCAVEDIAFASFEVLYNPEINLGWLANGVECDDDGNPLPTQVELITGTTTSGITTTYLWESADAAITPLVWSSFASNNTVSGKATVLIDNANGAVLYRVTATREYTTPNGTVIMCGQTSQELNVILLCNEPGPGGFTPTIDLASNPGFQPSPTALQCGAVSLIGSQGSGDRGNIPSTAVQRATWTLVNPSGGVNPTTVTQSPNVEALRLLAPFTFSWSVLDEPGIYNTTLEVELTTGDVGRQGFTFEVPIVPKFSYSIDCIDDQTGKYHLKLDDVSALIAGGSLENLTWDIQRWRNNTPNENIPGYLNSVVNQPNTTQIFELIPEETAYYVRVYYSPLTEFEEINPGEPYTCHVYEDILIPAAPIADFELGNSENLCTGQTYSPVYEEIGEPEAEFRWDWGDGTYSLGTSPSKTYSQSGSFPVTLTVVNSIGCEYSITKTVELKLGTFDGTLEDEAGNCNESTLLTFVPSADDPGLPPYRFSWSTGDNVNPLDATELGLYALRVYDENGCYVDASYTRLKDGSFPTQLIIDRDEICFGESTTVRWNRSAGFDYFVSLNGGTPTPLTFTYSFNSLDGVIGLNTIVISSREQGGNGTICDSRTIFVEVNESPDPPTFIVSLTCDNLFSSILASDPVLWYNSQFTSTPVGGTPRFERLFNRFDGGETYYARAAGSECNSLPTRFDFPQYKEASFGGGCFDCESLPAELTDASGQVYESWRWVFVPAPGSAPCTGLSGTNSAVTPWANYRDCGDGKFYLEYTVKYEVLQDGDAVTSVQCEQRTEDLCVTCSETSCDGPVLIATNTVCRTGEDPDSKYFYINFNTNDPDPADGTVLCADDVDISNGGVFEGDYTITFENGGSYNIEGLVRVPKGVDPATVCVTLNFCTPNSQQSCYQTTACLGSGPKGFELDCDNNSCGGPVEYDVDASYAFCTSNPVRMELRNIRVPINLNCEIKQIGFNSETGVISNFTASDKYCFGQDCNIVTDNGERFYVIDELIFDYQRFSDNRDACFRFDVKCKDGSECSVSWCVDLKVECDVFFTDGENGSTEVTCVDSDKENNYFEILHKFGKKQEYDRDMNLLNVYGGKFLEKIEFFEGGFWTVVQVSKKEDRFLIHLGNPKQDRKDDAYFFPGHDEPIKGYLPSKGDVIVPVFAEGCEEDDLGKRSLEGLRDAQAIPEVQDPAALAIAPNPLTQMGSLEVTHLADDVSVNWTATRIFAVNGAEQLAQLSLVSSVRAEVEVSSLAPGLYFLQVALSDGSLLQSRFVKH